MIYKLSTGLIAVGVFVCAAFTVAFLMPSSVSAQAAGGAIGTGGSASGGGGESVSLYSGYGWYRFPIDTNVHPRNAAFGPPWSQANSKCKAVGAGSITAFVVFRPSGGLGNSVNLKFLYSYTENIPGAYYGNRGGRWMTYNDARASYNRTPVNKSGYTWGENVGWFCSDFAPAPPPANRWTINGQSYVNNTSASTGRRQGTISVQPGNFINWTHDLRNEGPNNMNRNITYRIDRTGFSNNWNGIKTPSGSDRGNSGSLFVNLNNSTTGNRLRYQVTQNDVGKTLCQRISWIPRSWNDNGRWQSNYACAAVPFGYNLIPHTVDLSGLDTIDESVEEINLRPTVQNDGSTKSHLSSTQVVRMVVGKGTNLGDGFRNSGSRNACAYYTWRHGAGIEDCDVLRDNSGGNRQVFNPGTVTIRGGDLPDDISGLDVEVGDKICYVTSVQRYDQSASNVQSWRHSHPICITVVKKPKVQIHGGDLIVGRAQIDGEANNEAEIKTSITTKKISSQLRTFGSWVEYGVFAPRSADVASGAAIAGNTGAGGAFGSNQGLRSPLTFENISQFGYFSENMGTRPDVRSQFSGGSGGNCGGVITMNSMNSGRQILDCSGQDVRVKGNLKLGQSVVIKAKEINIVDDITYDDGQMSSLDQIPQAVLIADNIVIASDVSRVDAWLIGDSQGGGDNGWVVTCTDTANGKDEWQFDAYVTGNGGLTSEVCDKPLQVNGPVMANGLFLRRTAGSGTGEASNDPAEIINLRADAYLWASQYGTSDSKITTTYTRDLAPRF